METKMTRPRRAKADVKRIGCPPAMSPSISYTTSPLLFGAFLHKILGHLYRIWIKGSYSTLTRVDGEKSSHQLSRREIASDNPCSQHLSGNTLVSRFLR